MFDDIIKNIQVCIPFKLLIEKYLPMIVESRINPEIGIDGEIMDTYSGKDFLKVASILHKEGLSVTLHGPFYDLVPGGMDKKILQATRDRLKQAFDLIPVFEPLTIVCHTGYDKKRYFETSNEWLETAIETWTLLIKDIEKTNTVLVIENVYEKTPNMLLSLLRGLYTYTNNIGFCFDIGHMNAFSATNTQDWLKDLGPFLKQVHLHDNNSAWDDHQAIGTGNIDFNILFDYLKEHHIRPIITLEAHEEAWIWQSLETLSKSATFLHIVRPPTSAG